MMQQRERLYHLDKPILARDAAPSGPDMPEAGRSEAGTAPIAGPSLPPGWIGLEHCNLSPTSGQDAGVAHVLLHPE